MSGVVDLINPKLSFGPMDMANQIPGGGGAPPVLPPNYRNAYMQNGELTFTNPRYEAYNISGGGWPDAIARSSVVCVMSATISGQQLPAH